MTKYVLTFLITTVTIVAAIYHPQKYLKDPVDSNKYPYIVSIHERVVRPKHLCGGVIISTEHVLTSSDCLTKNAIYVMAGSNLLDNGGTLHLINKTFIYENKKKDNKNNNLAIAKVSPKFIFGDDIISASLEIQDVPEHTTAFFAGWGAYNVTVLHLPSGTHGYIYHYPNYLQEIQLKVISNKLCNDYNLNVNDEEVCTLKRIGEGLCNKDQGGPLIIEGTKKVIGIATEEFACGIGLPDVYIKVAPFIEWIKSVCHCV